MTAKIKVLFISQEIMPFVEETYLSKISRTLPQGIQEKGHEVRCFMPRYGCINERRNQLHEVIRLSGMNIIINDTDHPLVIKVASIPAARLQVYFIDNEEYFKRKAMLKDPKGEMFADNDERAIFFARGVIETIKNLGWAPDIIHCHGWFTNMIPLYLRKIYKDNPIFADAKVVYSLYDDEFSSNLPENLYDKVKFDGIPAKDLKHYKNANYLSTTKAALDNADAVIINSESVNPEIQTYLGNVKKPILGYNAEENLVNTVNDFYEEVLQNSTVLSEK
ncbi:MAG: glycogen/starch synthase [Bacteroidales bacterium]|nr:glycogen/starch synthase [Bacteroidales bacterium]MDY0215461.1 glycogen/starch synthase [Bacteroidales bacterium]